MRTETTSRELYKFDELTEEARETAIEGLSDINVDYEWAEYTIEDARECAKLMGIDIDKVYFSGFASQGDGACFEGSYSHAKGSMKAIKAYAPKDETLHGIALALQDAQKPHAYGLTAKTTHSGHYMHRFCTTIDVVLAGGIESYVKPEAEKAITEALRDFMLWIYNALSTDYDYRTSTEAIKETIEANDYEFTAEGEQA